MKRADTTRSLVQKDMEWHLKLLIKDVLTFYRTLTQVLNKMQFGDKE